MPVSFDMAGLKGLTDRVMRMAGNEIRMEMSQVLAAAALKEISDSFRFSRDPYGQKWRPLVARTGQPLLLTGRMRASVATGRVLTDGFTVVITAGYAKYHQYGTRGRKVRGRRRGPIPKRQMVPDAKDGIGDIWARTFKRDGIALIKRRFGHGH